MQVNANQHIQFLGLGTALFVISDIYYIFFTTYIITYITHRKLGLKSSQNTWNKENIPLVIYLYSIQQYLYINYDETPHSAVSNSTVPGVVRIAVFSIKSVLKNQIFHSSQISVLYYKGNPCIKQIYSYITVQ